MNEAVDKAATYCGGRDRLAEKLKISPGAVSQWVHEHRPVPAKRCKQIEYVTDGTVTCEDLRPDIFGPHNGETEAA